MHKFLTFSFDDGTVQDERLIALFDQYGLKGTFNLNSGRFGVCRRIVHEGIEVDHNVISESRVRTLYQGHEIAAHTVNHPNLVRQTPEVVIREVDEDCKALEALSGQKIFGMAYPGAGLYYTEEVAELIRKNTQIRYARGCKNHQSFVMPQNLMLWEPTCHQNDSELMALAEQGLIIPINEIIDKYSQGPAKEAFDKKFPTMRPLTTAEDGNSYWFCNVQSKYYGDNTDANGSFSMLYRRDWADKLGIAEPTNLEEFTQMLRDFREKDANGNGQQDEIMFIDPSSFRTSIAQWFGLPTDMIALDPVENKIVSPWNSPNVKPYFEYLNSLVQEGILDPSVAGNWELMAQKRAENKLGCLWDYTNAMWNEPTVAEIAPDALYAPLMPLPALDGVEPGSMSEPGSMVWERYVVTKDCEDLEAVARLLDIVYSDEYAVLTAFGQEGVNFTYEDGVMTPIPDLTADMAHEQRISEGAMLWNGVLPRVQEVDMRQQVANCDDYKRQVTLDLIDYDLKYPDQVNNFLALPTKEESDKINALLPNLQTASKELATKLTLGQISVDDLDKEVEKLEELGLSELVDIYQARYERYLANMPS